MLKGTVTPQNQNHIFKPIPEHMAVKVFKTTLAEYRYRDTYIADDYRFQDRFKKLNGKKLAYLWAEKEMRNLERIEAAKIPCPEVVLLRKNVLLMRFLGTVSDTTTPAKKLSTVLPSCDKRVQERCWLQVNEIVRGLWLKAKLVHADLSAYNLLFHENIVHVIDVAQAVEPTHPKALSFLYRDLTSVTKFFGGKLKLNIVPNPINIFLEITNLTDRLTPSTEFISELNYLDWDAKNRPGDSDFSINIEKLEKENIEKKFADQLLTDYIFDN